MSSDANLNLIVVLSFCFLAFCAALLTGFIVPVVHQLSKTLIAYEKLAFTMDKELPPILIEVNKLLGGVTHLQSTAYHKVSEIGVKVDDLQENVTKVAQTAKKHSSVISVGLLAGVKAYFDHNKNHSGE